jgi:hypothetical protein
MLDHGLMARARLGVAPLVSGSVARGPCAGWALLALALVAASACGGGDDPAVADAAVDAVTDAPADAGVDLSAALFPRDRLLDVRITMAPGDWDTLRNQEPGPPEATCASQPGIEAYTYFRASITIDGVTVSDVGVRKKGNLGSLSTTRPGLKIKAAEYVAGQRIAGQKQLTLNNNRQDETLVSQCLGYELFRAAGLPAPRCAFARVWVNGTDLGVYSHVETIRDQFLARHFADDSGRLYESGGDFARGMTGGFQPKTDETMPDCSDLDRVVLALSAPDDELVARLGAVVDLGQFMRYWAMEVVTGHWDGYANNRNNYYFYHDPTSDRMHFIPWGIDALFTERQRTTRPQSVYACGAMTWRLYDAAPTRALYLAALRDVLATVWDEAAIVAEVDRLQALLAPVVDPTGAADYAERLDATRAFVRGRAAVLEAELARGEPVWPYASDQSCLIRIGTIDATFSTTWGTLGQFGVGSATMRGVIGGVDATTSTGFASAGLDDQGAAAMQVLGQLPDGRFAVIFLGVNDPTRVRPGALPIDLRNQFAALTFYDPVTMTATGGGLILPGTLTFTRAATTAGAPVVGTLTGTVIEL